MRLSREHGFSMIAVMGVMLVTSLLGAAAFSAVGADIPFARAAQDRKQAYAAAEAGIEYYLYQLSRDNDYWTSCADVPDPAPGQASPVTLAGEPRSWRRVAGAEAEYSIELLPANGASECSSDQPAQTMLDSASGTFRIRSTGRSRGVRRSIVASFRRSSFLDFLYFTDLETSDPQTYATQAQRDAADEYCKVPRAQRQGRGCREITFPDFDAIRGPLHTNDDLLTCGSPDFGREGRSDRIEIHGPAANGWTAGNGCGGQPAFHGTKVHRAPHLAMPTSNAALEGVAEAGGLVFEGATTIRFDGSQWIRVTTGPSQTTTAMPYPGNGVIYVRHRGGCTLETPLVKSYPDPGECAVVTVSGRYADSLTIGSQADVLIDGDLTRAGDSVLGLIANNFVRVRHQVHRTSHSCSNVAGGTLPSVEVHAAILTLEHSFIVDNYSCGAALGTLRVEGAIAQKFRGPVGTFSGGTLRSGYTKDYWYDDRLKYRSPPFFLDPVSAAWRVVRTNEQVPAAP